MVLPIINKLGAQPLVLRNAADNAIDRLPKAYGGDEPRLSRELNQVLDHADKARAEMGDEYLSTEHLLLAMADRIGARREQLLAGPARRPRQPPGHQPEPRGAVPGAREVRPRPHRPTPGPASSTPSSAVTTRSAA